MKTSRMMRIGIALAWGLAGAVSSAWAQGSLTPPGAPAPAMKTLTQVEPRIPITNAPFTITQPGSYYLTTNLTTTGHGIVIQANGVTLDLMGFSLAGDRGSSDVGIWLSATNNAPLRDVVVRGGIVGGFAYGVRLDCAQNSRMEALTLSSNLGCGVYFKSISGACYGNTVRGCAISGNGTYGIYLDGDSGRCDGNTIVGCAVSSNATQGVYFSSASGQCNGNAVAGCVINGNGGYGVHLYCSSGECNGNTIANCTVSDNAGGGVYLNGSSGTCDRNTVVGCTVDGNGSYGVLFNGNVGTCDGNTLRDCSVGGNGSYGVYLYGESGQCDGNTVSHSILRKNVQRGISGYYADGNRIENNHVSGTTGATTYGIYTANSIANLILQNSCVGQTNNYSISVSDTYGPIVTSIGALATTNGAPALSPWANFSR